MSQAPDPGSGREHCAILAFDPVADDANMMGADPWVKVRMKKDLPIPTTMLRRLIGCQSGATAIEYGLIAGLIFLVIVAAVTAVSTDMSDMYNTVANAVTGNM
jgi:pilus assembly protein Flp/PilA